MKKLLYGTGRTRGFHHVLPSAQDGIENEKRTAYRAAVAGKRVIHIPMTMQADLNIAWYSFLLRQAKELGYTIELRDANWSTEAGARALTAAISEKPDLIVLQNPDVQSYARLLKQATRAGIKVIQLNMESLTPTDTYVGADWQGIGYAAGEEVAKKCSAPDGAVEQDRHHHGRSDRAGRPLPDLRLQAGTEGLGQGLRDRVAAGRQLRPVEGQRHHRGRPAAAPRPLRRLRHLGRHGRRVRCGREGSRVCRIRSTWSPPAVPRPPAARRSPMAPTTCTSPMTPGCRAPR